MEENPVNSLEIGKYLKDKNLSSTRLSGEIEEINKQIEDGIKNNLDQNQFINLSKELSKKNRILDLVSSIEKLIQNIDQATELLNDDDFKELSENEINNSNIKLKELFTELEDLTVAPLPDDEKKAILEFRPGVGGVEASLFTEELFRMYIRYSNSLNLIVENVSLEYDPAGGIKEAVVFINSDNAFSLLRFESGVHRVQRVPKTESIGRIHTSTASMVVLPKVDTKDLQIKPEELKIDVYRSSGPGGQSVNTTDSAVRITHLPSGITVACQAGKSQHKNKEMALSILVSKLNEIKESKENSAINQIRESSIQGGDRSAKIRTYNFAQSRVTDHRINKSWFNIEEILNGNLDEIVKTVSRELRSKINP